MSVNIAIIAGYLVIIRWVAVVNWYLLHNISHCLITECTSAFFHSFFPRCATVYYIRMYTVCLQYIGTLDPFFIPSVD